MITFGVRARVGALAGALSLALAAGAAAQDDETAADAVAEDAAVEPDAERAAELAVDVAFMRECLETLAARGASARVCLGIVTRGCASEAETESTTDAAACVARESEVWQTLMDEAAAEAEAILPNAERASFSAAQDAWLLFRDAECAYEAALATGDSGSEEERAACADRMTAERTIALRARKADDTP